MTLDLCSDTHMHTTYSDGSAPVADMADAAFEKGLAAIAITDHVPLPFDNRYAMKMEQISRYRDDVRQAKNEYGGRMAVKTGLEMEYMPEHRDWMDAILAMGWDLTIASVHNLVKGERPLLVNGNETEFQACLNKNFGRDIKSLCRAYFHTVQEAVETGWFDVVGHLDVLKKYNTKNRFFNETEGWYRELVNDTLNTIHAQGMKLEINMGALAHPIAIPYPSPWIVWSARKKGIPLVMGSDAHHPRAVGQGFDRIQAILAQPPASPPW
ncbi:MAG: histidinol-phosphatase HisJ [Desulfotignum sp.]|nr:histidinol-phosphatase HisJ [Desulfotignum sp.]